MPRYTYPVGILLLLLGAIAGLASGGPETSGRGSGPAQAPAEVEGGMTVPPPGRDPSGAPAPRAYRTTVIGVIRLVGNEPFTRLVITTEEGLDFILDEASSKAFHDRQGTRVRAPGTVQESPVYAGPGRLIGMERILTPDEIVPLR